MAESRGFKHKNRLHKQMQQLSITSKPIIGGDELFLIKTLSRRWIVNKKARILLWRRGEHRPMQGLV